MSPKSVSKVVFRGTRARLISRAVICCLLALYAHTGLAAEEKALRLVAPPYEPYSYLINGKPAGIYVDIVNAASILWGG